MSKGPLHTAPDSMTFFLFFSTSSTLGALPQHVYRDGQGLLVGPLGSHSTALSSVQVLQQLDLCSEHSCLLGRGPAVTEACRPQFYLPGSVSSACPQPVASEDIPVGTEAGQEILDCLQRLPTMLASFQWG